VLDEEDDEVVAVVDEAEEDDSDDDADDLEVLVEAVVFSEAETVTTAVSRGAL
jgi:hypothetical protein